LRQKLSICQPQHKGDDNQAAMPMASAVGWFDSDFFDVGANAVSLIPPRLIAPIIHPKWGRRLRN
jgi:hypothetical protein